MAGPAHAIPPRWSAPGVCRTRRRRDRLGRDDGGAPVDLAQSLGVHRFDLIQPGRPLSGRSILANRSDLGHLESSLAPRVSQEERAMASNLEYAKLSAYVYSDGGPERTPLPVGGGSASHTSC